MEITDPTYFESDMSTNFQQIRLFYTDETNHLQAR